VASVVDLERSQPSLTWPRPLRTVTTPRPKLLDYTVDRAEMLYRSGDIFKWLAEGRLKVRHRGYSHLCTSSRIWSSLAYITYI
jgi:hypothetical protein